MTPTPAATPIEQTPPATPPELKPAKTEPATVTLRHPGIPGCIAFGQYATETNHIFNPSTDAELIARLQAKGFEIV